MLTHISQLYGLGGPGVESEGLVDVVLPDARAKSEEHLDKGISRN